jgi:hypothetical chaperone protein
LAVLGIDFGTSNCAAYVADANGQITGVPLEGDDLLLPSVIFTARREVAAKQIEANEFSRRLRSARADQAKLARNGGSAIDEQTLARSIEAAMRREALEEADKKYWDQTFFSMMQDGQAVMFGSPALAAYLADPLSGALVKSPKSFLGSDLSDEYVSYFEGVITQMLSHILRKAEALVKKEITQAVIGRPVTYHGTRGQEGNNQAVNVMEKACKTVGFQQVEFVMEPLAAALEYESGITKDTLVLVVDIGGGTTDCALVQLGPNRRLANRRDSDVLGYSGDRIGGTDFDQALAWHSFMPLLGKDAMTKKKLPIPYGILMDAISTRDMPAQLRFRSAAHRIEQMIREAQDPELLTRLLILHENQYQHRLINSAEQTKIQLTRQAVCTAPLDYLEASLELEVSAQDFSRASDRAIAKIKDIVGEVLKTTGAKPDTVFITGGMGMSPVVQGSLRQLFADNTRIEVGDMLGSVGKGLGLCAMNLLNRSAT